MKILNDLFTTYLTYAKNIEGWEGKTKTELANGYIKAEEDNNDFLMNCYFATLMCKYWYMIPYLYRQNRGFRLDIEEFVSLVEDSLRKGLSYRRWRDDSFAVSKEEDGAEKVFNRCIWSATKAMYKYTNQYNRKINYETISLDALRSSMKNRKNNTLSDKYTMKYDSEEEVNAFETFMSQQESQDIVKDLFEYFIFQEDYVSALIIDVISYGDCFRTSYEKEMVDDVDDKDKKKQFEVKSSFVEFDPKMVVRLLNKLNVKDLKYYVRNYNLNQDMMKKCLKKVSKIPNQTLYNKIDETLSSIRNNNDLAEMLCHR